MLTVILIKWCVYTQAFFWLQFVIRCRVKGNGPCALFVRICQSSSNGTGLRRHRLVLMIRDEEQQS
jgi:hypothetical protein